MNTGGADVRAMHKNECWNEVCEMKHSGGNNENKPTHVSHSSFSLFGSVYYWGQCAMETKTSIY